MPCFFRERTRLPISATFAAQCQIGGRSLDCTGCALKPVGSAEFFPVHPWERLGRFRRAN